MNLIESSGSTFHLCENTSFGKEDGIVSKGADFSW